MRSPATGLISIIVLLFSVAGCDSFSLREQFKKIEISDPDTELSLELQKEYVQRGETVNLYPGGGKEPYSFEIQAADLFHSGTLGSITDMRYTSGDSIGRVKIRVRDAKKASAEAIVTIIPPTPQGFTVNGIDGNDNSITLSWTYTEPLIISGFRILYSVDGLPFEPINTILTNSETTYRHTGLNKTKVYSYRMYAVAGAYLSLPTPEQSASPNDTP